ncbi:MAG: translation elongation factor EF-1 subunit alpha [Promethearchaeota archaeon]|nr:MAG: translation elongation factor EF-1 subunit alpha [Candidatus Lokiarchaeota archaeon]
MSSKKEHLNLIIIGHVDAGKSTTTGHLLIETKAISDREMRELEAEAKKLEKGSFKFAFIFDRLKEERERGLTIDLCFRKFETKNYYFTLIDAPGHRDFVKNMITGSSQADAAVLVISAKKGEFEAGISAEGQTREHAFLARTLGVDQVIVWVNKMDTVDWSQERYTEIKEEITELLKQVGYKVADIPFIPGSGWTGDNLNTKSDNLKWYDGPTLIQALDNIQMPKKPVDKPLRMPIQDVYSIKGIGTVPVGRIETGVMKKGDKVAIIPLGISTEIRSIEMHHEEISEATPGDNIGVAIRGLSHKELKRGMVISSVKNPASVVEEFTGQIIVIYHPTALAAGYTPVIHAHTAQQACTFTKLLKKIDPKSGKVSQDEPDYVKQGDAALIELKPLRPLVLEKYAEFPQLGRFAVRDMGRTVAVGVVKDSKTKEIEIKSKKGKK